MVEMRWVWGSEPAPEFGENMARRVKVLQYRYATKKNSGDAEYLTWLEWSEWIDVPTETEE